MPDDLVAIVWQNIADAGLAHIGKKLLIAVSGGADSLCLAQVLSELQPQCGYDLALAHVNYRMRDHDADADEHFVRSWAAARALPVFVHRCAAAGNLLVRRGNTEQLCRRIRYNYFRYVCRYQGYAAVLVGHTADDLAETVLMRIVRGSGMRGIIGMRAVARYRGMPVMRPLLSVQRAAVEEFLRQRGAVWRTDLSNSALIYQRNVIRQQVLPQLRQLNPHISVALARLSAQAAELDGFLRRKVRRVFATQVIRAPRRCEISRGVLSCLAAPVRKAVLREMLLHCCLSADAVGYEQVRAFEQMALSGRPRRRTFPGGVRCQVLPDRVVLDAGLKPPPELSPGTLTPEAPYRSADVGIELRLRLLPEPPDKWPAAPHRVYIDARGLTPPFWVRSRRAGDIFAPLGLHGRQSLKKFFSGRQVSSDRQRLIPLVFNAGKIIWVAGFEIADACKVTSATCQVWEMTLARLTAADSVGMSVLPGDEREENVELT